VGAEERQSPIEVGIAAGGTRRRVLAHTTYLVCHSRWGHAMSDGNRHPQVVGVELPECQLHDQVAHVPGTLCILHVDVRVKDTAVDFRWNLFGYILAHWHVEGR